MVCVQPIAKCYKRRTAWKIFQNQFLYYRNHEKFVCLGTHSNYRSSIKLCHYAMFPAIPKHCVAFQAKDSVWNASDSNAVTNSCTEAMMFCHLCSRRKEWGTKENEFGWTMMQPLQLVRSVKRHVTGWSNVGQRRNQSCSPSHY